MKTQFFRRITQHHSQGRATYTRAVYLLLDAENVDRTVGGMYGRKPRRAERPDLPKVSDFARKRFAPQVKAYIVLAARETPQFPGFVEVLPKLGWHPVVVNPQPGVPVVDLALKRMLDHIPRHADVILISHDGGYINELERLATGDRRVAVMGFVEQISYRYRENHNIELFDIERDVGAFDVPPPRGTTNGFDLDDLDPAEFM